MRCVYPPKKIVDTASEIQGEWPHRPLMTFWQTRSLCLGLLLPLCGIGSGCKPTEKSPAASRNTPAAPRPVRTAKATYELLDRAIQATGTLAPIDQATLSTKIAGRLELLAVDLGSEVKKGDLIARLEGRDYELRLLQAQALLAQARAPLGLPLDGPDDSVVLDQTSSVKQARAVLDETVKARERALKLRDQGILPDAELESAEANFRVAETKFQLAVEEVRQKQAVLAQRRAQVEVAKQELADTKIFAPFNGRVVERRAQVGEILSIASPIASIVRMDPLRLRIEISERDSQKIKIDQTVRLTIDGDTNHFTGHIKRLSPVISEQARTLTVEADFANDGGLRPGAFARAEVVVSSQERTLMLPTEAVASFAGLEKVFLAKDGKASERGVITGRSARGRVEILSGIKEGDVVVLAPGNLQNGQLITSEPIPPSPSQSLAPRPPAAQPRS